MVEDVEKDRAKEKVKTAGEEDPHHPLRHQMDKKFGNPWTPLYLLHCPTSLWDGSC